MSNPESHFDLQTRQGVFKAEPDEALIKQLCRMRLARRLETGEPKVWALLFDDESAEQVVARLRSNYPGGSVSVSIGQKIVTLRNRPTIAPDNQITVRDHPYA